MNKILEGRLISKSIAWFLLLNLSAFSFVSIYSYFQGDLELEPRMLLSLIPLVLATVIVVLDSQILNSVLVSSKRLPSAPGSKLIGYSEFVFSKRSYEKVFLPIVSDMREEYFEALSQNRIWKARWVRVRGTSSFFAAMGLDRAFAFVSFFVKAWKSVN